MRRGRPLWTEATAVAFARQMAAPERLAAYLAAAPHFRPEPDPAVLTPAHSLTEAATAPATPAPLPPTLANNPPQP